MSNQHDDTSKENQFVFGGQDLTNSADFIQNPDYVSGQNIDFDPQLGEEGNRDSGSGRTVSPFTGNLQTFSPEDPVAQNKKIRLVNTDSAGDNYQINVYDQNNESIITPFGSVTFDDMVTALDAAFAAATITVDKTDYTTNETVTYEILTINSMDASYINWRFQADGDVVAMVEQEAIDESIVKRLQPAVGGETLNKIYNVYTVNFYDPFSFELTGNSFDSGGLMGLTTVYPHGINGKEKVTISSGNAAVDGEWIAEKITSTTFALLTVPYALFDATGDTVITKVSTYMELWRYNDVTDKPYRMFGSTKIPVRLKNIIDLRCQPVNNNKDVVLWVDGADDPRYFEIRESWLTDGAININGGDYDYDTIEEESKLILNNPVTVSLVQQLPTGGSLQGATFSYSAAFSNDNINRVQSGVWTEQIPVSKGNKNFTTTVLGVDAINIETTSKVNEILISNITPGIFKYVHLLAIQYFAGTAVGYIVTKKDLAEGQDSIIIQHTGNENDTETVDPSAFTNVPPLFKTAKNISVTRERAVMSNLILTQIPDLTDWARTFTHNVCKRPKDTIDHDFDGAGGVSGIAKEFQTATSYEEVGYMINETYRFALIARDKKSKRYFATGFWVDDIVVNADTTNTANPFSDNRRNNPNTSSEPFNTNNLTDSGLTVMYVPYIEFTGIDWDYKINGTKVSDIIDQIQIVRAECVPEVLASGMGIVAGGYSIDLLSDNLYGMEGINQPGVNPALYNLYFSYPMITSDPMNNVGVNVFGLHYIEGLSTLVEHRRIGFYSPDLYIPNNYPTIDNTVDKILINGIAELGTGYNTINASVSPSNYDNALNYVSLYDPDLVSGDLATSYDIDYGASVGTGEGVILASGTELWTNQVFSVLSSSRKMWQFEALFIKTVDALPDIDPIGGTTGSRLVYMAQYFRPLTDKYGNISSTIYLDTHAYCNSGDATVQVFGGDTFTTSHYLKFRGENTSDVNINGANGGLLYYAQSRYNPQQRAPEDGRYYFPYNATLFLWLTEKVSELFSYNSGYNIYGQSPAVIYKNFDQTQEQQDALITAFAWSLQQTENALTQNIRFFPPLNLKIEDLTYGGITHHENDDGELVSWQPRMFKRHYFNPNNILVTRGGSELTTGDAAVMSQRSVDVTQFGCSHKKSIIKGQSDGGDDIFLWPSAHARSINRYGRDGLVKISDRANFRGYLTNRVRPYNINDGGEILGIFDDSDQYESLLNHDNTLIGTGIIGAWDPERKQAIFSCRRLVKQREVLVNCGADPYMAVGLEASAQWIANLDNSKFYIAPEVIESVITFNLYVYDAGLFSAGWPVGTTYDWGIYGTTVSNFFVQDGTNFDTTVTVVLPVASGGCTFVLPAYVYFFPQAQTTFECSPGVPDLPTIVANPVSGSTFDLSTTGIGLCGHDYSLAPNPTWVKLYDQATDTLEPLDINGRGTTIDTGLTTTVNGYGVYGWWCDDMTFGQIVIVVKP